MSAWEDRFGKNIITAMEMRDLINYKSQNLWRKDKKVVKIITDLKMEFDREFIQSRYWKKISQIMGNVNN